MATGWYYAALGATRLGPFSPTQLQELAAAGTILPIDTVWQEGNETGVLASRVRHLFAHAISKPTPAALQVPVVVPAPVVVVAGTPVLVPDQASEPANEPKARAKPPARKGRATAMKGCDIVGQDGDYARYRKKCIKCGHKDSACHQLAITNKSFKANYFCPKCRKGCEVSIQCQS